jgi:hypothetical protein
VRFTGGAMMQRFLAVLSLIVTLGVAGAAAAAGDDDKVVYKKKTIIDLSGATIEGELTKPEGSYIVNRKLSRFSTLIQARGDFNFELLGSANEL